MSKCVRVRHIDDDVDAVLVQRAGETGITVPFASGTPAYVASPRRSTPR